MNIASWIIPGDLRRMITDDNYRHIESRYRIQKVSLIVDKDNPFNIIGTVIPTIEKKNGEYYFIGEPNLFDRQFDLENTNIVRHDTFEFFDITSRSVKYGFVEPFIHIEQNCIGNILEKVSHLANSRDGTIKLKDLEMATAGTIHQQGIEAREFLVASPTNIIPYHELLNESMSVYSMPDSYIGNFIKKHSKNSDYEISVKFSSNYFKLDEAIMAKKAHWDAPILTSFDNLDEKPVAYRYDSEMIPDSLLKMIFMDPDNLKNRVEFYWKQLSDSVWQIEIEQVRNKAMPDYPRKYGMKYFHAVYDQELNGFVHGDAAVRIYTKEQFIVRYEDWRLDIQTFGKYQERVKLIKFDVDLGHDHRCKAKCKANHNGKIIPLGVMMDLMMIWFGQDPVVQTYFQKVSIQGLEEEEKS